MNRELLGKKILIMGGSSESVETVKDANEMGLKTLVVDPSPNAPAKNISWKSYDVDALDLEALVKICKDEKVDGVFVGLSERLLKTYTTLCMRIGVPSYCTLDQLQVFGDKILFKKKCREFGIPVINDYTLNDPIPYPVLVKPVDSSGSKGISVCNNETELFAAIDKAKSFSPTKRYLIEDYLEGEELTAIYTILDGKPFLSLINDRYVVKPNKQLGSFGIAVVFPSKYADLYMKTVHEKVCCLFEALDLKNAPVSLQAFVDGDKIRFYDPALRIGGGRGYLITEHLTGFNIQKALLRFAVTGKMYESGKTAELSEDDWKIKGKYSIQPNLIVKTGTIGNVEGMDKLKKIPGLISASQRRMEGERIYLEGTSQQTAVRLHLIADTLDDLLKSYQMAIETIKITSDQGEDMLLPPFDFRSYYDDYMKR